MDVCDRHADGSERTALIYVDEIHRYCRYTFDHLKDSSNRFSNVLVADGLAPGDRAGILLPQMPGTAIAHIAVFKAGAIAVPLFTLFGQDAIEFRLADSAAKVLVTDSYGLEKVLAVGERLPNLTKTYVVGEKCTLLCITAFADAGRPETAPLGSAPPSPTAAITTRPQGGAVTGWYKGKIRLHVWRQILTEFAAVGGSLEVGQVWQCFLRQGKI